MISNLPVNADAPRRPAAGAATSSERQLRLRYALIMKRAGCGAMLWLAVNVGVWAADPPPTLISEQRQLEDMQRQQALLYREVKEKIETLEESPRKEELKRLLSEIERRMRQEGGAKAYVSPRSNMTQEMRAFHAKFVAKVEDCGTRHFPKQGDKSLYGKGSVAVTLDRGGRVSETEIVESSRNKTIDSHVRRVIQFSSPFGSLPAKIFQDQMSTYKSVVIVTAFEFKSDDLPVPTLPEDQRCVWK